MRTPNREHRVVAQNGGDIIQETAPAELVAAGLEAVGTVRLSTADAADISIDEFLIYFSQRLNEVHEVVEGLLDIEGASFQQQGRAVGFNLNQPQQVSALDLVDFTGVGLEEFEGFSIERDPVEEVVLDPCLNCGLQVVFGVVGHQSVEGPGHFVHNQLAVVLFLQVKQVGQADLGQNHRLLVVGKRNQVALQTAHQALVESVQR